MILLAKSVAELYGIQRHKQNYWAGSMTKEFRPINSRQVFGFFRRLRFQGDPSAASRGNRFVLAHTYQQCAFAARRISGVDDSACWRHAALLNLRRATQAKTKTQWHVGVNYMLATKAFCANEFTVDRAVGLNNCSQHGFAKAQRNKNACGRVPDRRKVIRCLPWRAYLHVMKKKTLGGIGKLKEKARKLT